MHKRYADLQAGKITDQYEKSFSDNRYTHDNSDGPSGRMASLAVFRDRDQWNVPDGLHLRFRLPPDDLRGRGVLLHDDVLLLFPVLSRDSLGHIVLRYAHFYRAHDILC